MSVAQNLSHVMAIPQWPTWNKNPQFLLLQVTILLIYPLSHIFFSSLTISLHIHLLSKTI